MMRFPLVIEQKGPPRKAWQTPRFWWHVIKDALTLLITIGGGVGGVIALYLLMQFLGLIPVD